VSDEVTIALIGQKLDDQSCDIKEGFASTKARLDKINGNVQQHTLDIQDHETRIKGLEKFRDMALKALFSGLGVGVGIAVTVGGILFGVGKAVGWW